MRPTTDYIYTYSGQEIYAEEIRPEQIKLIDIAYGLAGIYRYNAQTRISVLRHSLALSCCFSHKPTKLYCLLHDAAEAYLMDVPVPKKRYMKDGWAETYEHIEQMIYKKYKIDFTDIALDKVTALDKELVQYEMDSRERFEPGSQIRYPGVRTVSGRYPMFDMYYRWEKSDNELISLFMTEVRNLQSGK